MVHTAPLTGPVGHGWVLVDRPAAVSSWVGPDGWFTCDFTLVTISWLTVNSVTELCLCAALGGVKGVVWGTTLMHLESALCLLMHTVPCCTQCVGGCVT